MVAPTINTLPSTPPSTSPRSAYEIIEGWSQLDDPNLPDLTVDQLIDFLVDENIQQRRRERRNRQARRETRRQARREARRERERTSYRQFGRWDYSTTE